MPLHDQQTLQIAGALRNQLLQTCCESRADVNETVQAIVDVLMLTLIMVGPDAERNIRRIADDMLDQIHKKL
jgi:hypothetical protein